MHYVKSIGNQENEEKHRRHASTEKKEPAETCGFFYWSLKNAPHAATPAPAFDNAGQHPGKRKGNCQAPRFVLDNFKKV